MICAATGKPKPRIRWKKNGLTITENKRISIRITGRRSKLRIRNAVFQDGGEYHCVAKSRGFRPQISIIQNSGNFRWYIKWKGPFRFGPTEMWSTLTGRTEIPFPFDKFVVPNTALLYPAFKNKVRVKYDISNSLNQLQFLFLLILILICH